MREFLKNIKVWSFLEAAFCIVFGIMLIAFQDFTKLAIIYTFGGLIMLMGFVKICNYFGYGIEPFGFVGGLIDISLSIIIFVNANLINNMNLFSLFFGIIFIVKSIFSIQWSMDCLKMGAKYWWLDLLFSLLIFALGVLVLASPVSETVLLILIGVMLILDGIYSIVDTIVVSKKIKKFRKSFKSLFTDDEKIYLDENDYDTK